MTLRESRALQFVARPIRWIHALVCGIFVVLILLTVVWSSMLAVRASAAVYWGWPLGYATIFLFMAGGAGGVILLLHAAIVRSLRRLKWPFLLFILTFLTLRVSPAATQFLGVTNTVTIRLENRADRDLVWINVHGRGELVEIADLQAGSSTSRLYRGRNIDYTRRNRYENRIRVSWFDGDQRRERVIVGTYEGMSDSLVVVFESPERLRVSVW